MNAEAILHEIHEVAGSRTSAKQLLSQSHQQWFRELKRTSYGPDGYPFTGLGYTYDWNPTTGEVGPSEFVLRAGERATIEDRSSTAAYCE